PSSRIVFVGMRSAPVPNIGRIASGISGGRHDIVAQGFQGASRHNAPRSRESRRVPLYASRFGRKPGRKKRQNFVGGGNRRLSRGIDEMLSDDAVRTSYVLGKEWRDVRVRGAVGQLAGDEAVAECRRVRRKALCAAELVAFESIGEYRQVCS